MSDPGPSSNSRVSTFSVQPFRLNGEPEQVRAVMIRVPGT